MAAAEPQLKVKLGDWIECDAIVREMIKHLQETGEIGVSPIPLPASTRSFVGLRRTLLPQIMLTSITPFHARTHAGGGNDFIEAEFDDGLFVKKGVTDTVVHRINQWIDMNSTLPEKKPEKK